MPDLGIPSVANPQPVALVAVTLAAASVLLMALWYLLRWVTALPRWVRGLIVGP